MREIEKAWGEIIQRMDWQAAAEEMKKREEQKKMVEKKKC